MCLLSQWPCKAYALRVADPQSNPAFPVGLFPCRVVPVKIVALVVTLRGTWQYRVIARIGWPGVSKLWVGEMASLICSFCLIVEACTNVKANLSLRYTSMLLGSCMHDACGNWAKSFTSCVNLLSLIVLMFGTLFVSCTRYEM